ncbi:putative 2-hydroxyacid dehydrogenase UNK4.10 [Neolecta irregularis DAH-3]|uniref:Putative 2-hydroxyacid dehydrogenase UNK4.10 n=1 Tax=Neolecta irregularis (strain DAH-3) TaxID=1198029 RepID=A0A1U7LML3_NEOID|nr:putative 2-hydroxyacid dehydrogenase UNK4.10 [Neolecta irregularis DAH-3]|eukprot:OLL23887.1 putative 2-hydroxyacid dehydrogenase UNK4.10 [Neolecta irregularis DAH-3]
MPRPQILLVEEFYFAKKEWDDLACIADILVCDSPNRESFIQDCASKYNNITCIYSSWRSAEITGVIDEELISKMPRSLRFIAHNGAGYDQIDVSACSKAGIMVSHTPGAVSRATADTAIFLILGCLRNFPQGEYNLRKGSWRSETSVEIGNDPNGKTLGILGMGGIGRSLAERARIFGMNVIYHNRQKISWTNNARPLAEYVSFEKLLAKSDVLSLNLPLNSNTRHIISSLEISKMKRGGIIVNTARGGVLDTVALIEALESGHLKSIGLDVFEEEPHIPRQLVENPRVLLLPHMGTYTIEAQYDMEKLVIENLERAVEQARLITVVPEQKGQQEHIMTKRRY